MKARTECLGLFSMILPTQNNGEGGKKCCRCHLTPYAIGS